MTVRTSKVDTYIDHEGPVADRYKWWGVYLIREKRRLQGIAEAVAGGMPLAATPDRDDMQPALPIQVDLDLPGGIETPDQLLARVDAELGIAEALVDLETNEDGQGEESKAHGDPVRDEENIPDNAEKRQSSGRGALLGKRKPGQDGEDF
jgi:hypothetical protein